MTVDKVPVFLPTEGAFVVIGTSTIPFHPSPSLAPANDASTSAVEISQDQGEPRRSVVIIGNTPVTYGTSGAALVIGGSSTLTPGGTVTINNVPIYLPTAGSSIVIGSSTIAFRPSPAPTAPPITPGPLVIQGHTLTPGGVITISNTPISLPPSGSALIVGGSNTIHFGTTNTLSIGSQAVAISQISASADFVIGDQTLTPGGLITVANTPISLPTSGSSLIIGGSDTIALGAGQTISVGSQAVVISQLTTSSALVADSQIVAPGSQAVISGVTVSVPTQGTDVIIDGSTTAGLGGAIFSALGIAPSTTIAGGTPTGEGLPAGASNGTTVLPGGFTAGSTPLRMEIWKNRLLRIGAGLGCVWAGAWT